MIGNGNIKMWDDIKTLSIEKQSRVSKVTLGD
jgi:hypothetical protein